MSAQTPPRPAARFVINAGSSVLTTLISITGLVWVNQFLLRRISPEEYTLIPVLASLMIFAEFFRIIFTRGLSRFMVEADARGDHDEVTRITSSMLPVLGAVACALIAAGLFVVWRIETVIKVAPDYVDDARIMFALLIVTLALGIFTTPICAGLYVKIRFVTLNLINLGTEVLRVGLLFSLLLGIAPQAVWVTVAAVAATLVNIGVRVGYTWAILPAARFRASHMSFATVKRLLSFSLWTSVQGFNMFAQKAAPALFLNRYSTALDVASFHLGNLPNTQIRKLVQAAAGPATPELTAIFATQGESVMQAFYYRGGRYYLWGALFLVPPFIVYPAQLIELYVGATYALAAPVMITLFLLYPFNWASAMFYQIAYAIGRIKAYNITSVALSIAALIGMYVFIVVFEMGAMGAAYGLTGGFVLVQLTLIWPMGLRLVNGSHLVFLKKTLVPGLIPFLAALAACWGYAQVVEIDTWVKFGAGCIVSASAHVLALGLVCLDAEDRALAGKAVTAARKKLGR